VRKTQLETPIRQRFRIRTISEIAVELEVSEQTIFVWRRQARIDAGLEAGVSTSENAELVAAKRPIRTG
jgi:transposase-like protein